MSIKSIPSSRNEGSQKLFVHPQMRDLNYAKYVKCWRTPNQMSQIVLD